MKSVFVAVLATLAVGFVLLFLDLPARAAVFQYDTPVGFLRSWRDLSPRGDASHANIYYEILDVEVPAGIKTKIYYFGAVYRIGFESVYLAAVAIPVLLVAIIFPSVGVARHQTSATALRWLFFAALLLHAAIVAIALWSRYDQHRRKERPDRARTRRQRWREVGGDITREVPRPDRILLGSGVVALFVNLCWGWRWAGVVGVAMPGAVWAIRYYRGVGSSESSFRRNLHAVTATSTYGLAAISLCLIGARWAVAGSPLDARTVVGWSVASLVGGALISARAHERKLLGSYATQRTWLAGKRQKLIEEGYFVPNDPVPHRPTPGSHQSKPSP